jgi:anti-sigma factor RsiW
VTTTEDDRLLLNAYIDRELDPAHALEFERRLADDPALADERTRIEALRGAMRARLPRESASPELRRRIAAIARPRPFAADWGAGRGWGAKWGAKWGAMAASIAVAFAAGSVATFVALGPGSHEPVPELLVASHVRALMASQPIDVASSDRHTVKPWFNGKLPQSPRVVDLTAQGFSLVGGRIDVIALTPAPTLVYRVRQHVISLTVLPAALRASGAIRPIDGYNVVEWTDGPLAYWAVSDVAAPELENFAKAFRAGDAEP